MLNNSTLQEHTDRVAQADKTVLLGRLVWYSVSDVCVSHTDVLQGLTAVGLQSHIPPVPKDFDIFRRVSSNAQKKKVATSAANIFENYKVVEIAGRGEDVVVRRIVVETVDRKGKTIDYKQLRDIEFHKKTGHITVTELPDHVAAPYVVPGQPDCKNPHVEAMTAEIKAEQAKWTGKLNAYAIREFVRKMVLGMGATLVREGGGVYFLTEAQSTTVDALETFVNALSTDSNFHSLPLIDDLKQRAMIKKAFESETVDAIDAMMGEISEIQRGTKMISSDRYAGMVTRFQELTKHTTEYEALLETGLGEAKSRLSLFQTSIIGLRAKVKS